MERSGVIVRRDNLVLLVMEVAEPLDGYRLPGALGLGPHEATMGLYHETGVRATSVKTFGVYKDGGDTLVVYKSGHRGGPRDSEKFFFTWAAYDGTSTLKIQKTTQMALEALVDGQDRTMDRN